MVNRARRKIKTARQALPSSSWSRTKSGAPRRALDCLCTVADATDETSLQAAGITRARALATVLPSDAANVFITLSARSLNPDIEIIARGEMPTAESKLLPAGADRAILPTHIGAERIAGIILYPEAARFLHSTEQMQELERKLRGLGLARSVRRDAGKSPRRPAHVLAGASASRTWTARPRREPAPVNKSQLFYQLS